MKIQQAIDEGYEYCIEQYEETSLIHLTDVLLCPDDYKDKILFLCEKDPSYVTLSDDEISSNIVEQLENQEEFYVDDDFFLESLTGCDELLKALSNKINENLGKREFYFATKTLLE